jgi:hypothetical protein
MKRYEPAPPRAMAVLAAAAMTVVTLSGSILAPASADSERRDVTVSTMSLTPQDHAFVNSGTLTTSIDIVAYRGKRVVPMVHS